MQILAKIFISCIVLVSLALDGFSDSVLILNTGDLHEAPTNLDRVKKKINAARQKYGHDKVLLVDAGDMLSHWAYKSREWSTARKITQRTDEWIQKMFNWALAMQYDAIIFGNHDFDEGKELITLFAKGTCSQKAKLPFICSNLEYPGAFLTTKGDLQTSKGPIPPPPYRLVVKNGVRIAIIGISAPDNDPIFKSKNKDYHFPDNGSMSKELLTAKQVNDECVKSVIKHILVYEKPHIFVFLTHTGDIYYKKEDGTYKLDENGERIRKAYDGIDKEVVAELCKDIEQPCIVIGGHTHNTIPGKKEQYTCNYKNVKGKGKDKEVPLIKSGKEGSALGRTIITYDDPAQLGKDLSVTNISVENIYTGSSKEQ